jgi:ferredoxin-NADP reductase/ferredoxin
MAERGAVPRVSSGRRRALGLARSFTSPLLPDDYLELINPLWSTRELRGRVERIERETSDAATVLIKPGWDWEGHRPGQYVRLGISVDGVHHWRAYSLTSVPGRADGCIAVTPKLVEGGRVSPFLLRRLRPGTIVRLGGVEGTFVLPDPVPARLLFISAGSGITPIMSMLRSLDRGSWPGDAIHVHGSRTREGVIFGRELRELAERRPGYRLHEQISSERGRLRAEELERLCPDWAERETFMCGPAGLLEVMREHWERAGVAGRLHVEHFQPGGLLDAGECGIGGTITFCRSGLEGASDGSEPILIAGERAGAELPHGCRMGICHTCAGRLRSGQVRDLRTGRVHGQPGETIRTCISAPEGAVEIDL